MQPLFFLLLLIPTLLLATSKITVFDSQTHNPVSDAQIIIGDQYYKTDHTGTIKLAESVDTIRVKAVGYRPLLTRLESDSTYSSVTVDPITVKALYLSFWGAGIDSERMQAVLELAKSTEINAVVVDVKNEFGLTSYKTGVKEALELKAHKSRTIRNISAFMHKLKEHNIYTIARVVVFKDGLRALSLPDTALKTEEGDVWTNREGLAWLDPFIETNHHYNIDIAEDAARLGFDEINFDYIRFPEKSGLTFSKENVLDNRVAAINSFLKKAKERLQPYGTFISVDTFGQVSWDKGDTGIGQTVSSLQEHADYLSPMLYPSGFSSGMLGLKDPTSNVYHVVHESLKRIDIDPKRIRPWLQAFKDYAHSRSHFRAERIRGQIDAAEDHGSGGWLLWNPRSRYKDEGLKASADPSPFNIAAGYIDNTGS
ncbi:MAG: putative glycoside hydrolase, partial [Sulfurimonadaceae bacterium]|nr:putative glycoside hydrolase [Sulfurimonadaceae bacterium]